MCINFFPQVSSYFKDLLYKLLVCLFFSITFIKIALGTFFYQLMKKIIAIIQNVIKFSLKHAENYEQFYQPEKS